MYVLGPEKSDAWKKAVLGGGTKPEDLCQNLLCLFPTLHLALGLGLFAFKPLDLSPDKKILRLELHFLNHLSDKATRVDVLTDPPPPTDHTTITQSSYRLSIFNEHLRRFLHSGDIIELSTSDPDRMPHPNIEILEMQWILERIPALTAAAEPQDEDEDKG